MRSWVSMLASRKHRTRYIGMTNNIARRLREHREGSGSEFVSQYGVTRLVYMEPHGDVRLAIQREKTMKEWPRAWKVGLIEKDNPEWQDLCEALNR